MVTEMPPLASLDWVAYTVGGAYGVVIALEHGRWETWVRAKLGPPDWRRDPVAELATATLLGVVAVFWPFTAPLRKIARAYTRQASATQPPNTDHDGDRK
jgi:hypothetical protein